MATYLELRQLFTHGDLRNKVEAAIIIAAEGVYAEDPGTVNHANRIAWAKAVLLNPGTARDRFLMVVLAANKDASVAVITGASDAAIQTKVDDAVDLFADGS